MTQQKPATDFHQEVSSYYDQDADLGFKDRAESNALLDKIRNDFRQITLNYPFDRALEIGCGPGFDVCFFAGTFPGRHITGVDISQRMVDIAAQQIQQRRLTNAKVMVSDERKLKDQFGRETFDMVYVYFGALNTVADLGFAAAEIHKLLKPGGHAVLTFVNKWYLREMLVQALKLRFDIAFSRLRKEWGGYSPSRHLPSRCYSPKEILGYFSQFRLIEKKGYSIRFPAWYNPQKLRNNPQLEEKLWLADQQLQNTFWWDKGEYTLFVFRKEE
jgi:SAM-dependent methyltransferase